MITVILNEEQAKKLLEMTSVINDPDYTHYAVNKSTNLIVNGWDYSEHESDELKLYKNDYFFEDLKDYGFNPNDYKILTIRGLKKYGIDPNDNTKWSNDGIHPCTNGNQLSESSSSNYENPFDGMEVEVFYDKRNGVCSTKEPDNFDFKDEENYIVLNVVVTDYEVENTSIGSYEFWGTKYQDKDTFMATPTEFSVSEEDIESFSTEVIDTVNSYINDKNNDVYYNLQKEFGDKETEPFND